mgnify:CR=1 FL=1
MKKISIQLEKEIVKVNLPDNTEVLPMHSPKNLSSKFLFSCTACASEVYR